MRRAALLIAGLAVAACGGGDDRPSREDARRCLEEAGLHVVGGEASKDDTDAPDAELIANDVRGGRVMVFIAYYDDEGRAERLAPSLRRNARRFNGLVERHGTLTLLWVDGERRPMGDRVRDCVL
jgi:hypothetical protein